MTKNSTTQLLLFLLLGMALGATLFFSPHVSLAVQQGITLCYRTVFPSLFPFFVLSTLLISLGFSDFLENALNRPMQLLFHLNGGCAGALILGLLGGYPVGARTALSLYRQGDCTREEAERLLAFCNNCGPAFILSVAGSTALQSRKAGVLLYLIHVLAALCTGLIFRGENTPSKAPRHRKPIRPDFVPAFVASVQSAFSSMLSVCGFVVFFAVLLHPLKTFTKSGLLLGTVELFNGICSLEPTPAGFVSAAALIGWGGLSVHAQTVAILCDENLSLGSYFKGKAVQTFLSVIFALFTALFLPWQ